MINRFIAIILFVAAASTTSAQAADELVKVASGVYAFGKGATTLAVVTDTGVVIIDPIRESQAAAVAAALPV